MLNDSELQSYYKQHNVQDRAQRYIESIRNSDPSRMVGAHARTNVCTWYPSQKMGQTIQAESRTAEFGYVIEFEYDSDVLEYWDQLTPILVTRTIKNGVKRKGTYTPDFLILTTTGPVVIEVKTEKEIRKLIKKNPDDWKETSDGVIYLPAQNAFSELGLEHRVYSSGSLNPIRTANLQLLLQAQQSENKLTADITEKINSVMEKYAWITIANLAEQLNLVDLTVILQLINKGDLYCLIDKELLSVPESAWLSKSESVLQINNNIRQENRRKYELDPGDEPVDIDKVPTEKQAVRALQALARVDSGEKSRSVRRYIKQIEEGAKQGLSRFQSLIPGIDNSGNKSERINKYVNEFLIKYIEKDYPTAKRTGRGKAYAQYKKAAKKNHPEYDAVSYPTFRKYCDKADQYSIAMAQGGRRLANSIASPSDVQDRELKALLPFEKASLDHSLAKIKLILVKSNGNTYTARPWVTALVDNATRVILAIWISFKNPSTRSCAMAIRQCVRRHGKLPNSIVVDRGADFRSVYFNALLANYGVAPIMRPAAHSRYGSEVERFFGEFKSQWLSMRPGNFSSAYNARSVSSSHSPDAEATMTIETFIEELSEFIEWRNSTIIGGNTESPAMIFERKSSQYPSMGKIVIDDESFTVATAVDARQYTVDPARGIHINDHRYWHSDLKKTANLRKKVEVRIEPEDPYRVYALVEGKWVTCYASGEQVFQACDPVTRLAESMRVLEGRFMRDKAKNDAEQILVEKVCVADEKIVQKARIEKEKQTSESVVEVTSLFRQLKSTAKKKLEVSTWGGR